MIFSVVIPTYNRESVIQRAIYSVLKQTFQDFEIVVVDDGSKDKTRDVIGSFQDKRVRYVWQENQGATVARNTGILNAKGDYVSFLDSDDEWLETMLEKQYKTYLSDPDVGCVYSNVQIIGRNGIPRPFSKPLGHCNNSYMEILTQGYMAPTSALSAKRTILIQVGMFDVQLPASQDDDICFKLSKNTKVGYIPEILANMYVGQTNRISVSSERVAKGWWMLWNKYEQDIIEQCGVDVIRAHYYDTIRRFAIAYNKDYCKMAEDKYLKYGGSIGLIKASMLRIAFVKKGKVLQAVYEKILTKLWLYIK